jgi:hypothetical protein
MKTKHLDNEIERLNLMERTEDLSEYGQDMLNEFRAIKQALTIPVVSNRRELLIAVINFMNKNYLTKELDADMIADDLKAINCC